MSLLDSRPGFFSRSYFFSPDLPLEQIHPVFYPCAFKLRFFPPSSFHGIVVVLESSLLFIIGTSSYRLNPSRLSGPPHRHPSILRCLPTGSRPAGEISRSSIEITAGGCRPLSVRCSLFNCFLGWSPSTFSFLPRYVTVGPAPPSQRFSSFRFRGGPSALATWWPLGQELQLSPFRPRSDWYNGYFFFVPLVLRATFHTYLSP